MARLPPKRTSKKHRRTAPKPVKKEDLLAKNPNVYKVCKTNHPTLGAMWSCTHGANKLGTSIKSMKKSKSAESVAAKSVSVSVPMDGKVPVKKSSKTNSLKK